jgi:hypothetical protein
MNAAEAEFGTVEVSEGSEETGEVFEVLGAIDEIP